MATRGGAGRRGPYQKRRPCIRAAVEVSAGGAGRGFFPGPGDRAALRAQHPACVLARCARQLLASAPALPAPSTAFPVLWRDPVFPLPFGDGLWGVGPVLDGLTGPPGGLVSLQTLLTAGTQCSLTTPRNS